MTALSVSDVTTAQDAIQTVIDNCESSQASASTSFEKYTLANIHQVASEAKQALTESELAVRALSQLNNLL